MNKAFKRKVKYWHSSKYYLYWAANPSRTFTEWINAQPQQVVKSIYGKSGSVSVDITNEFTLNRL